MASSTYIPPDAEEHIDGAVAVEAPDIGTLAVLNKSEIDQQIATAKRYQRSITQFRKEAAVLVTLDDQAAAECIYALPRDGKTIEGPTSRFAEILASAWGNCRAGARVVSEDGDFVTSQGMFYDLEKNVAYSYEVKRRIVDKYGKRFKPDMIGVTANAACSIALRNAVLKGIPKPVWKGIYLLAKKTIMGDIKTLTTRRQELLNLFKPFGVTPEMVCRVIGVDGIGDIMPENLVTIQGMLTALQDGDSTVEEMFKSPSERAAEHIADATQSNTDKLKERYVARGRGSQQPTGQDIFSGDGQEAGVS